MNFPTLCAILVTYGLENPEFTLFTLTPFAAILQKSHITPDISECPGTILTYFTGLVGVLVGIINPIFVWRSPKERCCGNQLNLVVVRRHRQEISSLFTSAFDKGLADNKFAFKSSHGNNQATSCTNLLNFRPIISEFRLLKREIFAAIRLQFDDNLSSSRWHSKTDWNIAILISE